MKSCYLYVFVRCDLSRPQQTVQSAHAAMELYRSFPSSIDHPHLVILGVPGEGDLWSVWGLLQNTCIPHVRWHEPDLDGSLTAIACGPVRGKERRFFRTYPLLKGE